MKKAVRLKIEKFIARFMQDKELPGRTVLETKIQRKEERKRQLALEAPEVIKEQTEEKPAEAEEETFFGKMFAAAYHGLTGNELFNKQPYPQDRRNASRRNKLTDAEVERLHNARKELRSIRTKA